MKINKPYTGEEYADLAVYCNQNGLIIEDKGDYLEAVNPPEKSVEQKQADVRSIRNQYLEQTDKYLSVSDFPIDDDTKEQYRLYRQYLRDYTKEEGWCEHNPMTFEEWKEKVDEPSEVVNE